MSTLDSLLPYEIAVPNDGPFRTLCLCMPGVDASSLSVELDQSSRRIMRITGSADPSCMTPTMAPFTIDRTAPENNRFVLARENISLVQSILTIRYTLESCHDFQKIFKSIKKPRPTRPSPRAAAERPQSRVLAPPRPAPPRVDGVRAAV